MKQRHLLPLLWLLLGALTFSASLQAQNEFSRKSVFTLNVGPSWYSGQFMGITNDAGSYSDDLRKGMAWSLGYWYQGKAPTEEGLKIGPGFIYQGSSYRQTHETGADKIGMHYLAPQFGVFYLRTHYQLQLSTGIGYQFYNDKSTVYGKSRKVSMDKIAYNLALGGEYYLSRQWGVSARLNWLASNTERYSVRYNGKTWNIEHPENGEGYFGQLSLLVGLNYHF